MTNSTLVGSKPLLELVEVSKRYAGVTALDNVTFAAMEGEILGLLGDNGAGKSTLIKTMSGIVTPDEGTLRWQGAAIEMRSRQDSARLGIETIFQDGALVDSLSVARNIFMGREITNRLGLLDHKQMREITREVLHSIVGIRGIDSPEKPVGGLSGGQKQAVAIARAVHFKNKLLLLDEPTSALAVRATEALFDYLRTLRSQGLTSILVTHDIYDAYRVCDRFVVMSQGRVVMDVARGDTNVEELVRGVSHG
jgi:simple sugar transport system ATP-binding protein